ncbi:MAG: hypothetical protein ABW321_06630 [Polyangiales bacterium]
MRFGAWLVWWLLNAALFVPSYLCARRGAAFWPDPSQLLSRDNQDVFRVAFELGCVWLLTVWTARWPRAWRVVRVLGVTGYLTLLVFLAYHQGVRTFFARKPALGEDWRLALNLGHFLGSVMSPRWLVLCVAAALVPTALGLALAAMIRRLQLQAQHWSRRQLWWVTGLFLAPCFAVFAVFGLRSDAPVVQLLSKRVYANAKASYYEAQRLAEIRQGEPDRTYDGYRSLQLARKPDVYLLMLEAYGEVLATWDMAPAYRVLMARVEARLAAAGYSSRSVYSHAPVHGGTSWFSISSVHTGMRIDRPTAYDALVLLGPRVPSITGFFREHGYGTYALMPGNTHHKGLYMRDTFAHDVMVDGPALGYEGPQYGFGVIPDQYAIGVMRERYLPRAAAPRYVFYMCVTTHFPWDSLPPYVRDFHDLSTGGGEPSDVDASWPAIPEAASIGSPLRQAYFRSIAYEWRLLVEWLEHEPARDVVVAILGDHQPRLETDVPGGVNLRTPLHVLARDPAFVERFAEQGFQPGMYADPQRGPSLRHEGFFSLWVSKLMAAYGAPDAPPVQHLPHGLGLSGLNR